MGLLLRRRRSRGGRQGGRGVQGVEDVLPGGGERRVQRAGQHGVVWYGGERDRRGGKGQGGRVGGAGVRKAVAPRAPDPTRGADEGPVAGGDPRREAAGGPVPA